MMRARKFGCLAVVGLTLAMFPARFNAYPSVYPTGTTIYKPDMAWSGYTIFSTIEEQGAALIDMNGNLLRQFKEITAVPSPARILPGGYVVGGNVPREPHQESIAMIQIDWEGREVWRFDRTEEVKTEDEKTVWAGRLHHDWQREGNPVGYYAPGMDPETRRGRTLILAHKNVTKPEITDKLLEDDYIIEVSWDGEILWDWLASDHVDEFGFSEDARNAIYRSVNVHKERKTADWLHINAMSYIGPNRWYDEGDERFHPDNILVSAREASFMAIIGRDGSIVWRLGPDYTLTKATSELGQIIGQHNPHIIPKGLPGAGNLMVFDNGGAAGYGWANPATPNGRNALRRDSSRVLEINPVTLEKVWEYSISGIEHFRFFSFYVSNAQRLPNGNTMINEGAGGRIFEVTKEGEIVWEYISPFFGEENPTRNTIYRAHRVPYDWIPQLERPEERPVVPPDLRKFNVPAQ
jgi:hypothetical protein